MHSGWQNPDVHNFRAQVLAENPDLAKALQNAQAPKFPK